MQVGGSTIQTETDCVEIERPITWDDLTRAANKLKMVRWGAQQGTP